jgi:hypothetical protein
MAETETETILCPELLFPLSSHPELLAPSPQVFSLRERRDEFRMVFENMNGRSGGKSFLREN